jgi:hypothetical protein
LLKFAARLTLFAILGININILGGYLGGKRVPGFGVMKRVPTYPLPVLFKT